MSDALMRIRDKLELEPYVDVQVRIRAIFKTEELFECRNEEELKECIIDNVHSMEVLDVGLTEEVL